MKELFRSITKYFSTFLLALILSITVWISAVINADPTEERVYPRSISIDFVGKDPGLILLESSANQVSLTLSAPNSIWDRLTREASSVRALVDLSDLGPGEHEVEIQIQIAISPVRIISYTPPSITILLDSISTRTFPVQMIIKGEPALGYQAAPAILSQNLVSVSGPSTRLDQVEEVRVTLDITGISETIERDVTLQALDGNGRAVNELTVTPENIKITQNITQRGGYRNVIVKVITTGQIASGYRVTNISVYPPAVTVFSDDPVLVEQIPGYIETIPIDLAGIKDDLDLRVLLNLPPGILLVEEQDVEVQVGVAAIEGSITLENMALNAIGLAKGYDYEFSPATVDLILSGPLPILDKLTTSDIRILVDLQGLEEGVYQRIPQVVIAQEDIRVQSMLPGSLEVKITILPTPTVTPTTNLGEELNLTPTVASTPTPLTTPIP